MRCAYKGGGGLQGPGGYQNFWETRSSKRREKLTASIKKKKKRTPVSRFQTSPPGEPPLKEGSFHQEVK